MSEKRILCVGMCVLDVIHLCDKYPEEDSDKRCLDGYWQRGGNASNNCTVLNKLGAKTEFLGMISSAPAFQFLYADCKQRNIVIDNCPKSEMNPPFSSVILVKNKGTRTIIHANPNFPILKYEHFLKINLHYYSWIHFEARNEGETKKMIELIQQHNNKNAENPITISVELEKLNKELFILAMLSDMVFVSKDVAKYMGWSTAMEAVSGAYSVISNLKIKHNMQYLPNPSIICPWGSDISGALDSRCKAYYSTKAVNVENVVDSLGAGDTFVAAVIFAINNLNKNLEDALTYANQLASFKIQHRGYDCVENFKI